MRKLIMKMSVSLDGFVGDADGKLDWIFKTADDQSKAWVLTQFEKAGFIIMGRKSFEGTSQYWPTSTDAFAKPMNELPKAVFTRKGFKGVDLKHLQSPASVSWENARVCDGNFVDEINELKAEDGKPIIAIGGAEFMRSLIAEQLIDEFYLAIHPVVLGKGLPIFNGVAQGIYLKLNEVRRFPGGVVGLEYGK